MPRQARSICLAWLDKTKIFRWLGLTRVKISLAWPDSTPASLAMGINVHKTNFYDKPIRSRSDSIFLSVDRSDLDPRFLRAYRSDSSFESLPIRSNLFRAYQSNPKKFQMCRPLVRITNFV